MFQRVDLPTRQLDEYVRFSEPATTDKLLALARDLRHLRFVHINSTASGGGVAEILRSLVPLMQSLRLEAEWFVLAPPEPESFFRITKKIHNLLQGQEGALSPEELDTYLRCVDSAAADLKGQAITADVWMLHDPQLLPLARHINRGPHQRTCWVCHIDLSAPNLQALEALLPLTSHYDALIFSKASFVPLGVDGGRVHVVPPAIDPSSDKNAPLSGAEARAVLAGLGIDPRRPLVTQVSRFDVWKDPWGVIDAYRTAKACLPDLQLALLGLARPKDDPEAAGIVESVIDYAGPDPDIHLFWDSQILEDRIDSVVNAFQVVSQAVIQKSTREGFGLTVTEAMWKRTPVIGGNVGGIRDQIQHGVNGFLVDNACECGQRVVELLQSPSLRREMGEQARESVRSKYLLPRLLQDYLSAINAHL